jgi:serine/threonine-protein kinase
MGGLSHDHVAKILDCDEHEGQPFIVLEYMAHSLGSFIGESYRVESPSRIIAPEKASSYLRQTLSGLERLHFAGIVHRDIKPYNLMLTSDDRVKIIDFGLSRVRGEEETAIPGMQVGSPYYAAPEQSRKAAAVDGRADVYSVGALGYRMLTGSLYSSTAGEKAPPSALNPELDPAWDELLARSLAKDPEQRFASALEMRLALETLPIRQRKGLREELESHHAVRLVIPRSEARRVMYKDIRTELELDELLRPYSYWRTNFTVEGPLVVKDLRTGLRWQRRGSGFTLDWFQAQDYVDQLNAEGWQGRSSWRLPTIEELRSVLGPPLDGVACSTWPLFDSSLHWLWSADRCTKKQAWMADLVGGYFDRLDHDGAAAVCAVCSDSPSG